jgi:hypothetical protein
VNEPAAHSRLGTFEQKSGWIEDWFADGFLRAGINYRF